MRKEQVVLLTKHSGVFLNSSFYKNLKLGYMCEERVSQFLRNKGFEVWNVGSYRLPVDLLVWKGDITFWVQVKFRNDKHPICPVWIKRKGILETSKESGLPVILILEFQNKLYQVHLEGKRIKLGLSKPPLPFLLPVEYTFERRKSTLGEAPYRSRSLIK